VKHVLAAIVVLLALAGAARPALALPPEGPAAEAEHGGHEAGSEGAHEHYHPLDTGALFVQIFGFVILFGMLAYWVFPPVSEALGRRRAAIAKRFDDLERGLDQAAGGKRRAESELQNAERRSLDRMAEATKEGARLREELVEEGTSLAAKIHAKARVEAAIERAKLMLELRNEVVDVGFRAAEAVIREAMDEETQDRLVASFIDGLDAIPGLDGRKGAG
jgi:F-type H+-transporting ATPase subunit b